MQKINLEIDKSDKITWCHFEPFIECSTSLLFLNIVYLSFNYIQMVQTILRIKGLHKMNKSYFVQFRKKI